MKITLPSQSVRIAQALHKRRKLPKWAGILPATLVPNASAPTSQRATDGSSRNPRNAATNCVCLMPCWDEHSRWCRFDVDQKVEEPAFETLVPRPRMTRAFSVIPSRFRNSYSFASRLSFTALSKNMRRKAR